MAETSYRVPAKESSTIHHKSEEQKTNEVMVVFLLGKIILRADPFHQHNKCRTQMAASCAARSAA